MKNNTKNTNTNSTKTFTGFASMKALLVAAKKVMDTYKFKVYPASTKHLTSLRGFANADGSMPLFHAETNHEALAIKSVLKQQRKLRKTDLANLDNIVQGEDLADVGTTYSAWYAGRDSKIKFALETPAPAKAKAVKASKPKAKATKATSALTEAAAELQAGKPVIITNVQGGEETIGSVEELLTFALAQRDLANKQPAKATKQVPVTIRLA